MESFTQMNVMMAAFRHRITFTFNLLLAVTFMRGEDFLIRMLIDKFEGSLHRGDLHSVLRLAFAG
jgi:hypothetical protein